MNLSSRVFAILEDNTVVKLPNNKLNKLHKFDKNTSFSEFKNKKIKIAMFLIELKNRKPYSILEEFYSYYEFDKNGRLDEDKYFEQMRLHLDTADLIPVEKKEFGSNVIDGTSEFYKKRIETQYQWFPTNILKNNLHLQIFR